MRASLPADDGYFDAAIRAIYSRQAEPTFPRFAGMSFKRYFYYTINFMVSFIELDGILSPVYFTKVSYYTMFSPQCSRCFATFPVIRGRQTPSALLKMPIR